MKVVLIGEDGKRIGEVNLREAEQLAEKRGKSLVMVAENTYRIADAGKIKYERNQKMRKQRANSRTHKIKEIKLKLQTDNHDLEIKAKRIRKFLEKGLKTKIIMQFKGRQVSFKEAGIKKIKNLINPIIEDGFAVLDKDPSFDGKNIIVFLSPA